MIELAITLRAIQSSFMVYKVTMEPGPASSVEDRSLRNIRPRGPRFESRRGLFFSDAIFHFVSFRIFAQMFDGNLQHRTSYIILTQPRSKAVATSLLSEEERSLKNRSYDVIMSQSDVKYILYYDILQIRHCNLLQ